MFKDAVLFDLLTSVIFSPMKFICFMMASAEAVPLPSPFNGWLSGSPSAYTTF